MYLSFPIQPSNKFQTYHLQLLRNSDGSETNLIKELVEGEVAATPIKEAAVEALAAAVPALPLIHKDKELVDKEREVSSDGMILFLLQILKF